MKKSETFAIGDVHGEGKKLECMLQKWNPDKEQLILLGDLIDRGSESLHVIRRVKQLKEKYGAITLMGNHEASFLGWLEEPDEDYFHHISTLESFLGMKSLMMYLPERLAAKVKEEYTEEIGFMTEMQDVYETDEHIFVHAGVNLLLSDWRNTSSADYKWLRWPFLKGENTTGKTIVFGHTVTGTLHEDGRSDVWLSPDKTKIGIDGGAVFGGLLHGLKITSNGMMVHSVHSDLSITETFLETAGNDSKVK